MKNYIKSICEIKVPFYDVDLMNVVWHGNYIKYFEVARCEVLDFIGYGYHEMKESGYSWPVIDLQVRYIKPATLGQLLRCEASIVEYENRLKIAYVIYSGDKRITKGHSVQVAVDIKNNEMQLVSPKVLYEKMESAHAQD
jgi:acyl-CoA thioester hydrolase